ncbi:MAG: NADH-quinone oxidoreductase subunit N [Deltaproteobacteria bacterium]|nr:NADH-quinone oxidoreductase subunit N [Deltaproteobacteria bacterium]
MPNAPRVESLGNVASLAYFSPELVLVGAILAVILWDVLVREHRAKLLGALCLGLLGLAYAAGASAFYLAAPVAPQNLFHGLLVFDRFACGFRILFAFVTAVALLFVVPPALSDRRARSEGRNAAEMIMLLLVVALGMDLMAASRSLLMIYVSLELVSVVSFVLAGFKLFDRKSSEGALKYVIFGGVASGVMLYGMSWIYGATGSLNLGEIAARVTEAGAPAGRVPEVVFVGVVCMLAGFGYKIAAAPFHMWTPDVYEGAPTAVTAFLSAGPKAAGFAVMVRFFADALRAHEALGAGSGGLAAPVPWPVLAGCLAMATMIVGNLSALHQDNVKRMLAYSSIAHAGYMLLGFAVFSQAGVEAIAFYLLVYCFMNLGAFLVVLAVAEASDGDETMTAFQGLGRRAPVMAVLMTIFLVSLTGLPPMAGFVGKFYLFAALIRGGGFWNWLLAVVGVLNSVISLFYYARVMKAMYLGEAAPGEPAKVRHAFGATAVALAVPVLLLGIYWGPVYDFVAGSMAMIR